MFYLQKLIEAYSKVSPAELGPLLVSPEELIQDTTVNALWETVTKQLGKELVYRQRIADKQGEKKCVSLAKRIRDDLLAWRGCGSRCYKIGEAFFKEVTARCPIPPKEILDNLECGTYFIEHPPVLTKFVDSEEQKKISSRVYGNLVRVLVLDGNKVLTTQSLSVTKNTYCMYDSYTGKIDDLFSCTIASCELDSIYAQDEKIQWFKDNYYRVLVNLLLYIQTGSPDLREFRPDVDRKSEKSLRKLGIESRIPVTLVSWGWKKPKEEHNVRGHFRWQACGKNWSETKLIWVTPHTRNKKGLENE